MKLGSMSEQICTLGSRGISATGACPFDNPNPPEQSPADEQAHGGCRGAAQGTYPTQDDVRSQRAWLAGGEVR